MQKHIFLIGPGAIGKTTLAKMLAKKLDVLDVHVDEEFIKRIGHIRKYIKKYSYDEYYASNSKLFYKLISENKTRRCVFAVTPGLLIRGPEKIRKKNIEQINKGLSILLVPFKGLKKSSELLFEREWNRGWYDDKDNLMKKVRREFKAYANLGDIKIYVGNDSKEKNLNKIIKKYENI